MNFKIKEKKYYENILKKNFNKFNKLDKNKNIVIFGAGTVGKYLIKSLKINNFKIKNFADNNPKILSKKIEGIKVISYKELKKNYSNEQIIIASIIYEKEILKQLKKDIINNVFPLTYLNYLLPEVFDFRKYSKLFEAIFLPKNKNKIYSLYNLLDDNESKKIFTKIINFRLGNYFFVDLESIKSTHEQYFDKSLIKISDKEMFVDGGGYIGDTIKPFVNVTKGNFLKICSFEPDRKNFRKLKTIVRKIDKNRIEIYPYGLYKKNGEVEFQEQGNPESGIVKNNKFSSLSGSVFSEKLRNKKLQVVSIDSFFENKQPPTLIKMDIEGAEIDALNGARKIISKYKPKLTICVYHNPDDLWEIPLLIKRLNPEYKIYLRHYSSELCETVCYAI